MNGWNRHHIMLYPIKILQFRLTNKRIQIRLIFMMGIHLLKCRNQIQHPFHITAVSKSLSQLRHRAIPRIRANNRHLRIQI